MVVRLLLGFLRLLSHSVVTLLRLCVLAVRTRIGFVTLALFSVYLAARGCGGASLRIGTFNVREFGTRTDLVRLTELLSEADSDVMAMQEIQRPDLMPHLVARLSERSGRWYQAVVSACGGKRTMHVGFLYDTERVHLDQMQEFPELRDDRGGSCSIGARAGLLGVFSTNRWWSKKRYSLLTVHFPAGAQPVQVRERQTFWARALQIATRIRDGGQGRVLVLGDVNSTGYRDNSYRERDAIHDAVARAGFRVLTPNLGCTEYFQPEGRSSFMPSHLDHIVGGTEVTSTAPARVLGFCETLRCAPTQAMPSDYEAVSDHCPVLLTIK